MYFTFFTLLIHKVPGLANNIRQSDLTNVGFQLVYNFPYNHVTTSAEILNIRSQCNASTLMCVGGSDSVNDPFTLRVVACAN